MPDSRSSGRLGDIISSLSQRFLTPVFEPHVTLCRLPDAPISAHKAFLEKLVKDEKQFSCFLKRPVTGSPPFQKFASEVYPRERFLVLSKKADRLLNGRYGKKSFFHVSLLYGFIDDESLEQTEVEKWGFGTEKLHIQSLALVKIEGRPQEWSILYTQRFGPD
jgi:hypothetical protein